MSDKLRAAWLRLPAFARSFVIDAVEGGIAAVLTLNLFLPRSLDEARAQAVIVGAALLVPVTAAARRRLVPGIAGWLVATFPRP